MKNHQELKSAAAVVFPFCLVLLLCLIFEAAWLTNDDAAMSMIAHGYGAIAEPSAHLVFSNLLWGKFIQILPTLGGLYGYSLATYLVVVAAGIVVSLALVRSGLGLFETFSLVTLLFVGVVIFPQFTLTSGCASVAGVICLLRYSVSPHIGWLLGAAVLLFTGFLVRDHEFALVALVALPLIPWKKLLRDSRVHLFAGCFLLSSVGAHFLNKSAYEGEEWAEYGRFMPAATEFVAWDAGKRLSGRNDLLERHGLTETDVALVENWLWFDEDIAGADKLREVAMELDAERLPGRSLENIGKALGAFFNRDIVFQVILGFLLLCLRPKGRLGFAWIVFVTAVVAFGVMGRPAILRVYYPPLALLILYPYFSGFSPGPFLERFRVLAVAGCMFAHAGVVFANSVQHEKKAGEARERISALPGDEPVVGYFSTFKANQIFTVTGAANLRDSFNNLYLFGWTFKTPYSNTYKIEQSGTGLKERLFSKDGVWMLLTKYDLFERYCGEHGRELKTLVEASVETGGARRVAAVEVSEMPEERVGE